MEMQNLRENELQRENECVFMNLVKGGNLMRKGILWVIAIILLFMLVSCSGTSTNVSIDDGFLRIIYTEIGKDEYSASIYHKSYKEYVSEKNCCVESVPVSLDFRIPSTYKGKTVTRLDKFDIDTALVNTVTMPNSIKEIGRGCFQRSRIVGITLSSELRVISANAFAACKDLIDIELPYGVSEIGDSAFEGCERLKNVVFGNGIARIGDSAFKNCNLTELTLPYALEEIGAHAFEGNSIVEVDINKLCSTIGAYAFCNNKTLNFLSIGQSVENIGDFAFGGTSLKSIYVDPVNPYYDSRYNCNAIVLKETNQIVVGSSRTVIPDSVVYVSSGAFSNCNFQSFTIDNVALMSFPFDNCTTENLIIGEHASKEVVNSIKGLRVLGNIIVDSSNPYFDSRDNCNAIIDSETNTLLKASENTVIPNSVEKIGEYAFYNLDITNIEIPSSVTTIEYCAFTNCNSLSEVIFNEGLKKLESQAFNDCKKLITIRLPEGFEYLSYGSFTNCEGIKRVLLPASLKAFTPIFSSNSTNLQDVIYFYNGSKRHFREIDQIDLQANVRCIDDNE